ncbi:YjgF-like protein [Penicillium longicatenatum]|nr:YjgF-like protein [Penicillium longicatenatum]
MSSLTYTNEKGAGQKHSDLCLYSQAVVIHGTNIVKCSGQGGWPNSGELNANDVNRQVELAFENVDRVLQAVGLRGWEDVYLIRSYQVDMGVSYDHFVKTLKARIPGHPPIWTAISVPRLAFPTMLIEIEVEAYNSRTSKL